MNINLNQDNTTTPFPSYHNQYHGMTIYENDHLTQIYVFLTFRTLLQKLRSWPRIPWLALKEYIVHFPDTSIYIINDKMLVMHPVTASLLKDLVSKES